jgi:hypothetical protein
LREVIALQHAGHGVRCRQLEDLRQIERREPLRIVFEADTREIENVSYLLRVCLGIGGNLLGCELRTCIAPPARIAHARRVVADDEDHLVAELLKIAQLAQ